MDREDQRLLVTGATGFIGRHLVRRLLAEGFSVSYVLRAGTAKSTVPAGFDGAIPYEYDGSMPSMLEIIQAAKPTLVFHLASLFRAQHTTAEVDAMVTSNVLLGTQILEAITKVDLGIGFINIGTSWQHYQSSDYDPVCLYASTKQAFMDIMRYYINALGLRAMTLSFFDTYGLDDPRPKIFNLLHDASKRSDLLGMSPGEQILDIVHVADVVDALLIAAERINEDGFGLGEEFAISSGQRLTLRELAEVYASVVGRPLNIEWGGRPYRPREVMVPWTSGTALPGWTPRISLRDGIAEFENSFKDSIDGEVNSV